jgi:hypothetical protein
MFLPRFGCDGSICCKGTRKVEFNAPEIMATRYVIFDAVILAITLASLLPPPERTHCNFDRFVRRHRVTGRAFHPGVPTSSASATGGTAAGEWNCRWRLLETTTDQLEATTVHLPSSAPIQAGTVLSHVSAVTSARKCAASFNSLAPTKHRRFRPYPRTLRARIYPSPGKHGDPCASDT